jgi:ABC-type siderophore export system fused ATPase/permease subunit
MFIGGLYLLVIQSTKIGTRIYDLFVGKSLEAPLQFFSEKNRKKLIDFFNEDLPKLEVTIPRLVTLTVLSVGYLVTTLFITALISPAMILPTILIATVIFCYTVGQIFSVPN